MNYTNDIREAVVRKAAVRAATQVEIAREFGISKTTVQNWLRRYRNNGGMAMAEQEKRPRDWTATERLQALIETAGLSEEALGQWCRGHGLHTHHLAQWRRELTAGQAGDKASLNTLRSLRQENRELKKALRRKEKALAETAALLVLKKKRSRSGGSARTIDSDGGAARSLGLDYGSGATGRPQGSGLCAAGFVAAHRAALGA